MSEIKSAGQLLQFLKNEHYEWSRQSVADHASIEARIVEVDGSFARVHRVGDDQPEKQFYPCIAPYAPRVGDLVSCLRVSGGLHILGTINRTTSVDNTIAAYARTDSPDFVGTPTAPNADPTDYSNAIATTAFVEDKLKSSPILGGDPKAPTPAPDDDSEAVVNTTWVRGLLNNGPQIASPMLKGQVTADSDAIVDLTTATKVAVPAPVDFSDAVPKGHLESNYLDKAAVDEGFPRKDGLTGGFQAPITGVDPTAPNHLATKGFIDSNYASVGSLSSYAPVDSPTFVNTPQAPTPSNSNPTSQQLANVSFVNQHFATKQNAQFSGTVTMPNPTSDNAQQPATTAWVTAKNYAPKESPALTGTPTAPTASGPSSVSQQIATLAFVDNNYLRKNGGAMNPGTTITLGTDPTLPMHAATRQYVLAQTGGKKILTGTALGTSGQGESNTVQFPVGTFTSPPVVTLTMTIQIPGYGNTTFSTYPIPFVGNVYSSQFTWGVFSRQQDSAGYDTAYTTLYSVNWIAVGT